MLTLIKSLFVSSPRSLVIVILASLGLSLGIIPEFSSTSNSLKLNSSVSAQGSDFSTEQLENYVNAVLNMEQERLSAYDFIKQQAGTVPEISCYTANDNNEIQTISRNDLRSQLQDNLTQLNSSQLNQVVDRAFNYCQSAQRIVNENNLTPEEFNSITNNWQQLENLLYPIFMQLQQ